MNRQKRQTLMVALVLLVSLSLIAVACGGGAATPAPAVTVTKTAPPVTVTIGATAGAAPTVTVTQTAPAATVTITPTPTKLAKVRDAEAIGGRTLFFIAIGEEQGFFEKRGIDLAVLEMGAAAARVAPFLGQAEVTAADPLVYYAERKDARLIGPYVTFHQSSMVRKDSPYRSYQDLKGKKVGILGPASAQYQAVKVLTRLEGLDLEKDFQLIIGEAAVQIGWLLKGDVDAIHIYEPFTSKLLVSDGDKVRELYWFNDLYRKHTGNNLMVGGVVTSEAWAKQNPELARQVGLAYQDAFYYAYGHEDVWKSNLAKKIWKVDDPQVLELLAKRLPGTVEFPPYSPRYKAALVKQAQLSADAGILSREAVEWLKGIILFAD